MPRCRALGVQGYPTFIRGIHAEERGSQGVWKGSSTRAPYDGVLPAPVDRGRPAWVTWSDGGRFIVPDTRNLKQMQQQQQKCPPKTAIGLKDTTGDQCSTFLGRSIRNKEVSASGQ